MQEHPFPDEESRCELKLLYHEAKKAISGPFDLFRFEGSLLYWTLLPENTWVWVKITPPGHRRFWSMLPLTRATHFGVALFLTHSHIAVFCVLGRAKSGREENKKKGPQWARPVMSALRTKASGDSGAEFVEYGARRGSRGCGSNKWHQNGTQVEPKTKARVTPALSF